MKDSAMKEKLIIKPAKLPVTMDEVKDHLRIMESDTSNDFMIEQLIKTAVGRVEDETGRVLITQTWDLIFDSWNELIWHDGLCGIKRRFPFGRCQSVESITYLDEDKNQQTVDTDQYEVSGLNTDEACIVFHSDGGFGYPSLYEVEPVTVRVVCGYGDSYGDIPEMIKTAIKIIVSDLYDDEDHEQAINSMLKSFKLWSF